MSENKETLVLGASDNPSRYSYMAIQRLRAKGHGVKAIGRKHSIVSDVPIATEHEHYNNIDTVTMYLNAGNQREYYDYIFSLEPKRIIFNPGAENPELEKLARSKGVETLEACTLVMLSTGQY